MDDFLTQLPTDMTANIDDSDSDVDMHAKYLQSIRFVSFSFVNHL